MGQSDGVQSDSGAKPLKGMVFRVAGPLIGDQSARAENRAGTGALGFSRRDMPRTSACVVYAVAGNLARTTPPRPRGRGGV